MKWFKGPKIPRVKDPMKEWEREMKRWMDPRWEYKWDSNSGKFKWQRNHWGEPGWYYDAFSGKWKKIKW